MAQRSCKSTAEPDPESQPQYIPMNLRTVPHLIAAAGISILAGCASTSTPPVADGAAIGGATSGTWSWRYRTLDVLSGEEYPAGRAELSGGPSAYNFRLILNRPSPC